MKNLNSLPALAFSTITSQGNSGIFSSARGLYLSLLFVLVTASQLAAQCQSPPETGDVTGNVSFGSSINWANPNRVEISDDLHARASLDPGDTSKYLMVADFDFNLPAGATILGIEVFAERHQDTDGQFEDASVRLYQEGNIIGDEKAIGGVWPDNDAVQTYGGLSDTWGLTLTAAEVNDPDFGVLISVTRNGDVNGLHAYIDYVTMVIHYDNPDGPCVLPFSVTNFIASNASDGRVNLNWETENERNTDFFSVEKSANGKDFIPVTRVEALNEIGRATYNATDEHPFGGRSWYRLRQTDLDGNFTLSNVVEVIFSGNETPQVTAYPNPATNQLTVAITQTETAVEFSLYDLGGSRILKGSVGPDEGFVKTIDLSGINRGIYLLSVTQGATATTKKIIVQ